jgi:predicted KAP-like P-loop ATPase
LTLILEYIKSHSTWAAWAEIILFLEMLKFSKTKNFTDPIPNFVKESEESF